jgi:hypothetical protein
VLAYQVDKKPVRIGSGMKRMVDESCSFQIPSMHKLLQGVRCRSGAVIDQREIQLVGLENYQKQKKIELKVFVLGDNIPTAAHAQNRRNKRLSVGNVARVASKSS